MDKYPKSGKYDPAWVQENWMGPHPLWLLEELCENMNLSPGKRVLDMGCGKGLTSVFLAKEYGVTVFANDLWIDPTENWRRFEKAGVSDRVFPIRAEAHALPYAEGFFDAIVAVDSYHYFGTEESYFGTFLKLVKGGGETGIVVPGLAREHEAGYPPAMARFWQSTHELFTFHSKDWWRRHWAKTGLADITACYDIDDPHGIWREWAHWSAEHLPESMGFSDTEFLAADTNGDIALIAMVAKKL